MGLLTARQIDVLVDVWCLVKARGVETQSEESFSA